MESYPTVASIPLFLIVIDILTANIRTIEGVFQFIRIEEKTYYRTVARFVPDMKFGIRNVTIHHTGCESRNYKYDSKYFHNIIILSKDVGYPFDK